MRTIPSLALLFFLATMPCKAQLAGGARAPVRDFALDITWPRDGEQDVYVGRPFELRITTRDSLSNPVDSVFRVRLTARFPGEFDPSSRGYFEHPFEIRGTTTLLLVPNFARGSGTERQWLLAYLDGDVEVSGRSPAFSVLPHAPSPFMLTYPPRHTEIKTHGRTDELEAQFRWEKPAPADPYVAVRRRAEDSTRWSDSVRYTFVFANTFGTPLLSYPSDGDGTLPSMSFTGRQLGSISRTYHPRNRSGDYTWFVEASDGTFTTRSTPGLSELRLTWESTDAVPLLPEKDAFFLEPNTPNPFRRVTSISFQLEERTPVRLSIHTLLGETVSVLCDRALPPGRHVFLFEAVGLAPGIYFSRLATSSGMRTRTMLLLR